LKITSKSYVICGYPRTGSNLLCEALISTGKLGYPNEYFDKSHFEPDYPSNPDLQLREALKRGTTPNGICGMKVFCFTFDDMGKLDWLSKLPSPHFIHLERQDALAQAVSYAKAIQTKQWTSQRKSIASPVYDADLITTCLNLTAFDRARWQVFFARNAIKPVWLTYEDLIQSMPECVSRISDMLGVTLEETDLQVQPGLVQQANSTNEEWKSRFLASKRNWAYLDRPKMELSVTAFLSLSKRAIIRRLKAKL
jgi:trehalose 2-sulfotransferase